jgi:xanthine dehydrogenase iron-sulfur cluster and FAD-binding subunit A
VEEAVELLDGESRPLAGGQSLMPLLNLRRVRLTRVVDLEAITALQGIDSGPGGELILGAGVTVSRIEHDPYVHAAAPVLTQAAKLVGNPQVRARGTVGGTVGQAEPVSEIVTALVSLGATATVRDAAGDRLVPIETLALGDQELIVDVRIPAAGSARHTAIHEIAPRFAARALVVAAAVVQVEAGRLKDVRIAVAGVSPAPAALADLQALAGMSPRDARIAALIGDAIGRLPPGPSPSPEDSYRRDAAAHLAARAVSDAASAKPPEPPEPGWAAGTAPGRLSAMGERCRESEITVTVNGRRLQPRVQPRLLLCDLLRGSLGQHATHVGCEHGVCGACNVLLDGVAVRSCLLLAVQADGRAIETLEGLRDRPGMEQLFAAFVSEHALQCGFCTPGLMVTLAELRRRGLRADPEHLVGNLCRCTGYAPIRRAAEGLR